MKNNDEELNPTAARKAARRKIMAEKRAAAKEKAVESTGENYTEVPKEETRENVSLKDRLKNTFASKKEDGEAKEVKDGEEKISLKERFARFTASLTPKKEKETGPLIIEAENMETAPETEETVKEETVSSTAAENLISPYDSGPECPSFPLLAQTALGTVVGTWTLESVSPNVESGSTTYK